MLPMFERLSVLALTLSTENNRAVELHTHEHSSHDRDIFWTRGCLAVHDGHLEAQTQSNPCKYLVGDPVRGA